MANCSDQLLPDGPQSQNFVLNSDNFPFFDQFPHTHEDANLRDFLSQMTLLSEKPLFCQFWNLEQALILGLGPVLMEHLKLNLYFHDFSSFSGFCLVSKLLVVFAVLIWVATWLWEPTNWEAN